MWAGSEGGGDAASGGERDPTSGPRARAAASGQGAKGGESPPPPRPAQSDSDLSATERLGNRVGIRCHPGPGCCQWRGFRSQRLGGWP